MEPACSLLLVDDDEEFLEIVARRFVRRGMVVTVATSPQATIDVASQQSFHVAIIDRSLAGQDGVQLMVRLRAQLPRLQVIMLSGHGDAEAVADALDRGAFDYLVKPSSLADLEAAVAKAHRASLAHGQS